MTWNGFGLVVIPAPPAQPKQDFFTIKEQTSAVCELLKINAVSPAESAFLTDVPHYLNACYSLSSTQELNRQHPSLSRFPKLLLSKLLPSHLKDSRDLVRQEHCTAGLAAEQNLA